MTGINNQCVGHSSGERFPRERKEIFQVPGSFSGLQFIIVAIVRWCEDLKELVLDNLPLISLVNGNFSRRGSDIFDENFLYF